jgi:DNA-binding NarL/FixJ family response regulator
MSDGTTRMLQAGASGYFITDSATDELQRAIQTVFAGDIYLACGVETALVKTYVDSLSTQELVGILTAREREVLQLLAEGKGAKQVAEILYISPKTVETHRKQIMDKLQLHSIAELTKYAIREGITPLGG